MTMLRCSKTLKIKSRGLFDFNKIFSELESQSKKTKMQHFAAASEYPFETPTSDSAKTAAVK